MAKSRSESLEWSDLQFEFDPEEQITKIKSSLPKTDPALNLQTNLFLRRTQTYNILNHAFEPSAKAFTTVQTRQPELKVEVQATNLKQVAKENQEVQKTTTTTPSPRVIIGFKIPPTKSPSPVMPSPTTATRNQSPFASIRPIRNLQVAACQSSTESKENPEFVVGNRMFEKKSGIEIMENYIGQRSIFARANTQVDPKSEVPSSPNSIGEELPFPFNQ